MTRQQRWWLIIDSELRKYFEKIESGDVSAEEAYALLCERYVIEPIWGIREDPYG